MRGTGLQSGIGIGDGTPGIVVEVTLDITADDPSEGSDEVVDLSRIGTSDGIRYTDSVQTDLVDGPVDGQQVDQFRSEGILGGEPDLDVLALDKLDDLDGLLGDPSHVLAVRVFTQEGRGPDDDIDTVHTRLDGESGVIHVTSDMSQDLGLLQTHVTDGLAVLERFGRGGGRGELDVFHTKVIQTAVSGVGKYGLAKSLQAE